jgi:hypothetical protein
MASTAWLPVTTSVKVFVSKLGWRAVVGHACTVAVFVPNCVSPRVHEIKPLAALIVMLLGEQIQGEGQLTGEAAGNSADARRG